MQYDCAALPDMGVKGTDDLANVRELCLLLDPLVSTFLLIDPLVGEPLPDILPTQSMDELEFLRQKLWGREIIRVALPPSIQLPIHQHPYLVHIRGHSDPLLEFSLKIARSERLAAQADGLEGEGKAPHRIGGWLQSNAKPALIADSIASMCIVNTDAYTKATYLRAVDRRILGWISYVMGSERVAAQLRQIQSWTYLDPLGHFAHLKNFGDETKPLRQTASEWCRMENGELLNRSLAQWLGTNPENIYSPGTCINEVYRVVEDAVNKSAKDFIRWQQRFKSKRDKTIWIVLMLIYPAITSNRSVIASLDEPSSSDSPDEPMQYLYQELQTMMLI